MLIRVLGSVEVVDDGHVHDVGAPRQRALLALLAARRGEVVSEDALVEMAWPDGEDLPENPHRALQTYISRLRALVQPELLRTQPPGYVLDADVDAAQFESAVHRARADRDAAALRAALGDWGGEPFAEMSERAQLVGPATRLRDLRAAAIQTLGEVLMEHGDDAGAVSEIQGLVDEQPTDGAVVALLMRALHRSGRQADALRAYQSHRAALAEAGLEPGSELAQLEQRIAADDPGLLDPVGRRLGSYELHEEIGEGAFGSVFRATQPSVGREVAIKVVRAELANDPEFVQRFEREAQTVARLEHPNIIPLHDFWRDPSGAYLVMRYLRGGSAEHRLVRSGPMRLDEVSHVVDQIGPALAVAHEAGVVHRDVKPANIIFDDSDNAYLADFGIAVDVGAVGDTDLRSAGSPLYVAPEQVRDGDSSPLSDIYAFGVVLYELLTATAPFGDSDSMETLLRRKLREPVPSLADSRPDVPKAVDLVVQTATDIDPGRRFASMTEVVLAYRRAVSNIDATTTSDTSGSAPSAAQIGRTLVSLQVEAPNPYRGLAAFGEADSAQFFGRDDLIGQLREHLGGRRFLVVTGPSGSGKSSVVRAGLLPHLRDDGRLVASIVPGTHPFDEVETALQRVATEPTGSLVEQLRADERGLARAIRRVVPDRGELVLVVDQFEELFTLTDVDERNAFLSALATAVGDERCPVRVVCTLRADFYDRPLQHDAVGELVSANTIAVPPLSGPELEAAITQPAAGLGVSIDAALLAQLVADTRGEPAALPLLQYALTELYERRTAGRLTIEAYREIGGIVGAVANRADEIAQGDSEHTDGVRRLFTRLVTPGEGTEDTRRRVKRSELVGVDPALVDAYSEGRLLTLDHDPASREPTVEVAHEAIIREWPRLRAWLDDDRDGLRIHRHLGAAAGAWEASGRDTGELYRGGRLEAAEEWASDSADDLNDIESRFLAGSIAQRQAEIEADESSRRRLRRSLAGVAVVAVIALIASAVAVQQRNRAQDQTDRAEEQTEVALAQTALAEERLVRAEAATADADAARAEAVTAAFDAETGRLVAQAESLAATNPRAAMLIAAAAHERGESPETLGGLLATMAAAQPLVGHLRLGTPYVDVEWLANDRIVGVRADGIDLIDATSGELLDSLPWSLDITSEPFRREGSVAAATAAGDGLVILDDAGGVASISAVDELQVRWETTPPSPAYKVAVQSDGPGVAIVDLENQLFLLDDAGAVRHRHDLDDASNLADQAAGVIPIPDQWIGTFAAVPVLPAMAVAGDHVVVATGAILHDVDWESGEVLAQTRMQLGGPEGIPAPVQQIVRSADGGLVLIGYSTAHVLDASAPWPDRLFLHTLEGTSGNSDQDPIGGVATGSGLVLGMVDGTLATFDADGDRVRAVDLGLGRGRSVGAAPGGLTFALAHDNGIALVSPHNGTPVALGIPRHPQSAVVSVDRRGDAVAAGPSGLAFGPPPAVWRLDGTPRDVSPALDEQPRWATIITETDLVNIWIETPAGDRRIGYSTRDLKVDYDRVSTEGGRGISSSDLSSDGTFWVLGAEEPREVVAVSPLEEEELAHLPSPADDPAVRISGVRLTPDDVLLLVGTESGAAALYNTSTWERIAHPVVDTADIAASHWSADGSLLATADSQGAVSIRDGATFEEIRRLVGNVGSRNTFAQGSLLFSPDNRFLLTNIDGDGRLWDVETGQQIGPTLATFPGTLSGANRGANGLQLVTAGQASMLRWNLDTDSWPDIACRAAGSNLTLDEWRQWGPRDEEYRAICPQYGIED